MHVRTYVYICIHVRTYMCMCVLWDNSPIYGGWLYDMSTRDQITETHKSTVTNTSGEVQRLILLLCFQSTSLGGHLKGFILRKRLLQMLPSMHVDSEGSVHTVEVVHVEEQAGGLQRLQTKSFAYIHRRRLTILLTRNTLLKERAKNVTPPC